MKGQVSRSLSDRTTNVFAADETYLDEFIRRINYEQDLTRTD